MSTPTKPVEISRSPRHDGGGDELSSSISGTPGLLNIGTPTGRNLRQFGTPPTPPIANIPPRAGAGGMSYGSPSGLALRPRTPGTGTPGSSGSPGRNLEEVTEEEMARVLRRHLVPRNSRAVQSTRSGEQTPLLSVDLEDDGKSSGGASSSRRPSSSQHAREDSEPFPIPYDAPGADVTHSIYKWHSDQRRQARPRAASFTALPTEPLSTPHPTLEHIHEPGGFRRNYVQQHANGQSSEEPVVTSNFIEFLYLFGHFAGEDLEEDEEEEDEALLGYDERAITSRAADPAGPSLGQLEAAPDLSKPYLEASETSPLLSRRSMKRSHSRRARRSSVGPHHGDATVTQALLMLLKGFVGTGVLFLGKAFFNGGILFSTITLVFIALISLYSFLLLVNTKFVVPGSFGDIGGTLYGPWMRYAILTSIAVSQLGFVCAYTIFVSQNLQAFVLAITNCVKFFPVQYLILLQLIIFLPLALIRNIAKLSSTALVADVFILAGLLYIFGSEMAVIADRGIAKVELFNPVDFPLLIGTAVFSFEGIGLIIPITDGMREPHKFPAVLTGVMLFLIVLFGGAGVLAYLAFGSEVQTVVITNLNSESKLVQAVQFVYSLAILLSVPLQLFPAVRIMENGIFTRSGKTNLKVKWQKNIFRFLIVMMCAGISWAGAADLDKFVALIGSFACVPLCYVYPPMLHYKALARTTRAKAADIALMTFGMAAAFYTTIQTIALMTAPDSGGQPKFGNCDLPPSLLPTA